MSELKKEITPVFIEDEVRKSYLDYAMSVIIGRALPDVRDGLKPVHRRILFAMNQLRNTADKPYKKSARIVGDVIGKYHPHGDSAVYDTIVRMAQDFSMRYPLVDGQGNFGSMDGDAPAAMRYTEIRMAKITRDLLVDLDKDTVDFVANYDGTEQIPCVLPARLPHLLINGSDGIAVGMATAIPPHNIGEVINACCALIDNPDLSIGELIQLIPGPDFPTAAIINGNSGIKAAYQQGRGPIRLRAHATIEDKPHNKGETIIVTELPYQSNKAKLIEKIALAVRADKIRGIKELRDESNKDGVRVVFEIKREAQAEIVLNNLYSQGFLEKSYGINMVVLDNGEPRVMNLKQILEGFIQHRQIIVSRRTLYLLRKAWQRSHILEGIIAVLTNIDAVIAMIKASKTVPEAKEKLLATLWQADDDLQSLLGRSQTHATYRQEEFAAYGLEGTQYRLSPQQVQAILELRLQQITALERNKIITEYDEKMDEIATYVRLINDPAELMSCIRTELVAIKEEFGDPRRTEIVQDAQNLDTEDLIAPEDKLVTLSYGGYAKTQSLEEYQSQNRGGVGKLACTFKDEDFIADIWLANTHDTLLCFSDRGKVYWLKVYQIISGNRTARGRPLINLIQLENGERITSVLRFSIPNARASILMVTAKGIVKKTLATEFERERRKGLRAIRLDDGDHVVGATVTQGDDHVFLCASNGRAIYFHESKVRPMGRSARGVIGMRVPPEHSIISLIIPKPEGTLLICTQNGYGKRTPINQFPIYSHRGGKGVIAIRTSPRNGDTVCALQVMESDDIMLMNDKGVLIRMLTTDIRQQGRNTLGVRLQRLNMEAKLVGGSRIPFVPAEITSDL